MAKERWARLRQAARERVREWEREREWERKQARQGAYWSPGLGILPHHNAAAMARIDAMLEFNFLYGAYTRDLDMLLIETGMGRVESRVLRRMGHNGTTSTALHEVLDMDRAQVSRCLHLLEAERIVTLRREPPDRRVLRVEPTPYGLHLLSGILRLRRSTSASPNALVPFHLPRLRRAD